MKLLRYGPPGEERPGLLDSNGQLRSLAGVIDDIAGEALLPSALARLRALDPDTLPKVAGDPRIGPCVGQVCKFVCIGLNYADHAAETGATIPTEPIVFNKWISAISGPYDALHIPRDSLKTDWEVELGVVVGEGGRNIREQDALQHVAGYSCSLIN